MKMNIRQRILRLLLAAGMLSFFVLGAVSLWGLYDARQESTDNGRRMGAAAGVSMEKQVIHLAQKRLMLVAQEKAHRVDRELRTIKEDAEYIALIMERLMAHPEEYVPRQVKDPHREPVRAGEVYLYYAPTVRSPEAKAEIAAEVDAASGIANTLENMAGFYKNYDGSILMASEKGFMYCVDLQHSGKEYVEFTQVFFDTFIPKERPWYKQAIAAGRPALTGVYMGMEGFPFIDYAAPVRVGPEIVGVVSIGMDIKSLYLAVTERGRGEVLDSSVNFVLNDKGAVVLSTEKTGLLAATEEHRDLRQAPEPSFVEKAKSMVNGHSGIVPVTLDGETYYLAYAPIPSVGWSFGTMVKASEVVAPAREAHASVTAQAEEFAAAVDAFFRDNLWQMGILLLGILAALAVASRKLAERFVQPILALTGGVREIAKGDLDQQLDIKTGDEIEELSDSVNHMTVELKEYMANLAKVTADKQRIATELSLAQGIQEGMLPKISPQITEGGGFELHATMEAAKSVGGDFYDFYVLDKEHLAVTMADVSGKGVPAALFMMISKTILKNNALTAAYASGAENVNWAEIMELSNRQLCENNEEMMFVTVFFGVLNTTTGEFAYVNGGHNAPLIGRAQGGTVDWQYIVEGKKAHMVGVMEESVYEEKRLTLRPGDMLYFYTDGVTEAMDPERRLYTEERLQATLDRVGTTAASVKEILAAIRGDIDAHANGAEQSDDITMLGVRFLG